MVRDINGNGAKQSSVMGMLSSLLLLFTTTHIFHKKDPKEQLKMASANNNVSYLFVQFCITGISFIQFPIVMVRMKYHLAPDICNVHTCMYTQT